MRPGHCFTIEPMINEGEFLFFSFLCCFVLFVCFFLIIFCPSSTGTWHDMTWPDDWASTTVDGKRSAQFEHTLLITETGVKVLTARK